MIKLILTLLLVIPIELHSESKGKYIPVTATYYNPTRSQCGSNHLVTASNDKIDLRKLRSGKLRWVAVSRDLRRHYNFGDTIIVRSDIKKLNGKWVVKDLMSKRHRNRIDFLSHEKNFLPNPSKILITKCSSTHNR